MDNKLKSKTRLTNIQLIFQHISTNEDIDVIRENFDKYYKNSSIENFSSKKKIKFEFNTNFLIKLNNYYKEYVNLNDYLIKINSFKGNNKKISFKNPYYRKDTSKRIFQQIKKILNKKYQTKAFYDVI